MKLRSLFLILLFGVLSAATTQAFVNISVTVAPPPLPVYVQPPCPVAGYLWTPGYWAYDEYNAYYWVPGVWVAPPRVGFLWTPGYWGFSGGYYVFHRGYWGPRVGFYGGVNYGFGYGGYGYCGGRWAGGVFRYNTAITRVNTTVIHNTYVDRTVINNRVTNSRASFNGRGGVNVRPDAEQLAASRGSHIGPTTAQMAMRQKASRTVAQRGRQNGIPRQVAGTRNAGRRFAQGQPPRSLRQGNPAGYGPRFNRQAAFRRVPARNPRAPRQQPGNVERHRA